MIRGPLAKDDYRPKFSGHETFPLRYGWLKKAHDSVSDVQGTEKATTIFSDDDAISRFGVGRNMVASIRHWATASGIIEETEEGFKPTEIGGLIFRKSGLDPYMEHPCTLWFIHWCLAGRSKQTTWFWAFNHFQSGIFERDHLVTSIRDAAAERKWSRAASTTIKRDVECFVRLYAAKPATGKGSHEDVLESPLVELGLIRSVGKRDGFRFVRGSKPTLSSGVFLYALREFWHEHTKARTLSFEAIAHEPGSPGRVFLLDEDEIFNRLQILEDETDGIIRYSETAGLKQVIRDDNLKEKNVIDLIKDGYNVRKIRKAA